MPTPTMATATAGPVDRRRSGRRPAEATTSNTRSHGQAVRERQQHERAEQQRPQPADELDDARPEAGRGRLGVPGGELAAVDEAGEQPAVGGQEAQRHADAPQLVAGVAPDHEQRQVGADDLPTPGDEHETQGEEQNDRHHHAGDDGDDGVEPRAEQVPA